jgi:DNA-binding transcriptional MerR regulator
VSDLGWHFTVTDAARFLGKSPVTLRKWEQQGIFTFSRVGGDRRLSTREMRGLARIAQELGRITAERRRLIEASLTLLELIERENRSSRPTRG